MAHKPPSHRMQGLLGEFKNLYEGRLGKLKAKIKADSTLEHDDNSYSTEVIQNYEVGRRFKYFNMF